MTAVVTGAARGIGAATAEHLIAGGAAVAVIDLDPDDATAAASKLSANGGKAIGIGCDVTSPADVEQMTDEVVATLGPPDILVNNAGILRDNLLHKMSVDDWDAVMQTHLRGSFLCSRAVQRFMVEHRRGCIVNLSSTSALGNRGQANYSAAKAGLQGFTKTLAIELGQFGIRVNAVAPGFIETAMTRATAERIGSDFEAMKRDAVSNIPLRRTGTPEDVANVIGFLCSPQSSYVSGQVIYVSGGPNS
ncbi:beta-ketoacyl-ACP reductase [Rhodococcus sp. 06-156-3C]|uniref:3-oxoacyl-ACP reductase FabG n=1 Tax=Nocardiaceae TaxID=85025 RepID=UPI000523003F|nr:MULTISPECIES: 3-oxoacyl-ACP reductase FabG [Rhodococcus]OZD18370.1 beta-ketoacyl-ACP reductase [Rhodococcus sp. 06-156-4C]OZD18967.1 beta-ketoacyl-ACP reductase [Rhodococcus sp. 06-156-3C]OZD22480.1 beta-ketoacyl-ACP reductase [Rhodococcus sp. 06-156-4a]OZD34151.1 beta-ketoacyl-ACP reductase [Rhodococcus sp. 06-156-3b]OZD38888.1 beta-ketoacyl-ACP reductase [Rhodococcus sp. 06-156-3]